MDTLRKTSTDYMLKESALDGAIQVYRKTLNISYQPETLLEEPYFSDIIGFLSNQKQEHKYFKVQGNFFHYFIKKICYSFIFFVKQRHINVASSLLGEEVMSNCFSSTLERLSSEQECNMTKYSLLLPISAAV